MGVTTMMSVEGDFAADGAVCVRSALTTDDMEQLGRLFSEVVDRPGPLAMRPYSEGGAQVYSDFYNMALWPRYRQVCERAALAPLVAKVLGCDKLWFFYDQIWWKSGGETQRTPWHQDASSVPIVGDHQAVVWIPLEPLAVHESLEFVRGSHRGPIYFVGGQLRSPRPIRVDFDPGSGPGDGGLPHLPDIEATRSDYDIISWAMDPGDILIFHLATLHGGAPTHAGGERRTVSFRFFGPDATKSAATQVDELNPFTEMLQQVPVGGRYSEGQWPILLTV
jgi:ectoine hydroxylase-related dioxygenase (phytanoyl-CoA dioxygenase family)